MLIIYNTLINDKFFIKSETENDDRVLFRIYMSINKNWIIIEIHIYSKTRNY